MLGLSQWLERKPAQLSGGQRQRVAMGRTIVREPAAFLMDEPLSNLDAKLRVQMRIEISRIQRHLGVATVYVTHDQVEAMTMGDRVAVMRDGVVLQCDEPQSVYERPVNMFVGAFIGSPAMNLYEGAVSEDAAAVRLGSQRLALPPAVRLARPSRADFAGWGVESASLEALNYVETKRELRLTAEFTEWLGALPPETVNRVAAGLNRVLNGGPTLGRPDVDLIKGSRHHNMKELRVGTSVRALFVFDQRDPLMLIGGDKRGAWNDWYPRTIRDADRLYDQHRRDNGKGGSSRHRDPPSRGR